MASPAGSAMTMAMPSAMPVYARCCASRTGMPLPPCHCWAETSHCQAMLK